MLKQWTRLAGGVRVPVAIAVISIGLVALWSDAFASDPLITRDDFAAARIQSEQPAAFGWSVAGAGDVNGDGYDDIIVGAILYDAGQFAEGAAFLYLGGATGIANGDPTAVAVRLEGNLEYAQLGWSVAGAGDVNGDGYDDVIVGGPGAAYVFLGSAMGIADGGPSAAATMLSGGAIGFSVAGAGDVNGDGYDDVIVGGPGAAYVFLGSATGIANGDPTTAAARLEWDVEGYEPGWNVAGAGDVNGDGYDDVIVHSPSATYVFLGSATGVTGDPTAPATVLSIVGEGPGWSVVGAAGAGDVNADGYADVIVGDVGAAYVFLGSAGGIANGDPTTADARLEANQGDVVGWNVASAGDVNHDGYDDVVIGDQGFRSPDGLLGAAFVLLGSASGIASGDPATAGELLQSPVALGWSVASAGDVNGDGYADVITSALSNASDGAALVLLGNTCGDGLDDDGDSLVDYPADPGCGTAADLSERGVACDDGVDDDGDGLADYPADPGCSDLTDASERGTTICDNGIDDDGDGRIDYPADPGCADPTDVSERGTAICDNGTDDDGDGRIDHPDDPGCADPADPSERGGECDNGLDDDGDGSVDYPADPGCFDLSDAHEQVWFGDGEAHVIDLSGSVPGEAVVVRPLLQECGEFVCAATPTQLRIVGGAAIGDLTVVGPSSVDIFCGVVGGNVLTSGHVTLSSGQIAGWVRLQESQVPAVNGYSSGQLDLSGGSVEGKLSLERNARAQILGGLLRGGLETQGGGSSALIAGGLLGGSLRILGAQAFIEIRGSGFNLPSGEVEATDGRVTGTLSDGSPLDLPFIRPLGTTLLLSDPQPSVCGNGLLEVGEECDDANTTDGDDCSSTCRRDGEPCQAPTTITTTTTTTTLPGRGCGDATGVIAARAEIDTDCNCAGAASHRSYVHCAKAVVRRRAKDLSLSRACKAVVRTAAVKSTCGRPGFVACCFEKQGVTTCKIKRATTCSANEGFAAAEASCFDACGASSQP